MTSVHEIAEDALLAAVDVLRDGSTPDVIVLGVGPGTSLFEPVREVHTEKALARARRLLARTEGLEVAALAHGHWLDHGGEVGPAILVEAHRAGEPRGIRLAQRYRRPAVTGGEVELVGERVDLGAAGPLLPGGATTSEGRMTP